MIVTKQYQKPNGNKLLSKLEDPNNGFILEKIRFSTTKLPITTYEIGPTSSGMKIYFHDTVWKLLKFSITIFFQCLFFSECEISKIGDSKCQDQVNVPECGFDKGDCCMAEVDKSECYSCECHFNIIPPFDPCEWFNFKNFEAYIFSNSNLPDCKVRDVWTIGNGHCQDEMNNYPCNFDGGDCCYPEFLYYKV